MRSSRFARTACAAAFVGTSAASAQTSASRPYIGQTLSTNPVAVPLGLVSGEYERALGRSGFAVGAGGFAMFVDTGRDNVFDPGQRWASLQGKLKFYPAQNGLRGFAVGFTAGVIRASRQTYTYSEGSSCSPNGICLFGTSPAVADVTFFSSSTIGRDVHTTPTLGATLDYNIFLGPQRRFLVGLGAGARNALRREPHLGPISQSLVDARLQIGYGF